MEKVRVAWEVLPCEELDGDTLNVFRLDSEHLGLYLLDVSGHGASAAMLSVALHRVLTPGPTSVVTRPKGAESAHDIVSPALVCRDLNSLFPMDADAVIPQYFTLIYGVLSTTTREFRFCPGWPPAPCVQASSGASIGDWRLRFSDWTRQQRHLSRATHDR